MTAKEALRGLVEELSEEHAEEALDYLGWLLSEEEPPTDEEMARVRAGEAEIERGEYVTLDQLRQQLRT